MTHCPQRELTGYLRFNLSHCVQSLILQFELTRRMERRGFCQGAARGRRQGRQASLSGFSLYLIHPHDAQRRAGGQGTRSTGCRSPPASRRGPVPKAAIQPATSNRCRRLLYGTKVPLLREKPSSTKLARHSICGACCCFQNSPVRHALA
jgi:hypothetical protein